jgi:hypothetical protein
MSQLDKPVPPAGEEIHLPGGSLHPVLLAVGLTTALLGVTISPVLIVVGSVLSVVVLYQWIKGARRELESLPASHNDH